MAKFRHYIGLRSRLLVVVLLVCAPLVALILHTAGDERRNRLRDWQSLAQNLTELANREEQALIGGTKQLLLALAESSPVRAEDAGQSRKLVEDLFASYPRYSNLGVVSRDGEVIASALPFDVSILKQDQQFFQRVLTRRAFSIGRYPTNSTRSGFVVHFGYPVLDNKSEVRTVVFATVDLDWFERFSSEIPEQLPPGSTWTKLDAQGTILTRFPNAGNWVGRKFPDAGILKLATEQLAGNATAEDPEGEPIVHAFATLPSQMVGRPLVTILTTPQETLFAEANHVMVRNLTWLAIAGAIGMTLGWAGSNLLVLRPLRSLIRYTARLLSGDDQSPAIPSPNGHNELGELTHNFNRMAEVLQQREAEKETATLKVQALSHRLVEVQEKERRLLARELHDEIGQSLTAAEMHLQAAVQGAQDPKTRQRLHDSIEAVERVLQQVHDLSLNLRPSMLDDLGLEPALRWYAHRQAKTAGLHIDFQSEQIDKRLAPLIETECFRIGQEAINNVVRHAGAKRLSVELKRRNGHLHLVVRDDGKGFDHTKARSRAVQGASLGLLSMEERASLSGGGLEFKSTPSKGTELHAWFPLKYHEPESSLNE